MSDPMTNTEVEDVLSSIRRLVSDNKGGAAPARPEPSAARDRLVLTPALRVSEEAEEPDQEPQDDTSGDVAAQPDPTPSDPPDSGVAVFPDDEAESEPASHIDDATLLEALRAVNAAPDGDDRSDGADPDDDPWADLLTEQQEIEAHEAGPQEADLDLVDTDDFDDMQPQWFEFADADASEGLAEATEPEVAEPEISGPEGADRAGAEPVSVEALDPDPAPQPAAAASQETRTLGDKIAALETLIAGQSDEWEPDGAGTDPYAGTEAPSIDWEDVDRGKEDDAPEAPRATAPQDSLRDIYEADPATEESVAGFFNGSEAALDDDVLDEDALRDLVADIVREELQGALGERITRNVRKLVRREIHRALAAQDLQ